MKFFNQIFIVSILIISVSVMAEEVIVLSGNSQRAPKIFLNENEKPDGYMIEITNEIGRRAGLKFEYKLSPWARALKMAETGETGVTGIFYDNERALLFDWSDEIIAEDALLVTKKGGPIRQYTNPKDLAGKKIGLARETTRFGFDKDSGVIFEEDNNNVIRLRKIVADRIDGGFFLPGKYSIELAIKEAKLTDIQKNQLVIHKIPVQKNSARIAFVKKLKNTNVLAKINKAIASMKSDGIVDKIVNKYFSKNK